MHYGAPRYTLRGSFFTYKTGGVTIHSMPKPPEGFNPPPLREEQQDQEARPQVTKEEEELQKVREELFGLQAKSLAREQIEKEGKTGIWQYWAKGGQRSEQQYRQEALQKGEELLTPEQKLALERVEKIIKKTDALDSEERAIREKIVQGDVWDRIPILKSIFIGEAGAVAGAVVGTGIATVVKGSLRYILGPIFGGAAGGAVFGALKEKYQAYRADTWLKDAGLLRTDPEKGRERPMTPGEVTSMPTDELMRAAATLSNAIERGAVRGSKAEYLNLLTISEKVNEELYGRQADQEFIPGRLQKLAERTEPLKEKEAAEQRADALLNRWDLRGKTSEQYFDKKLREKVKEEYRPHFDQLMKARGKQVIAATFMGAGKGALIGSLLGAVLHHGPSGEQIVAEWKATTAAQEGMTGHAEQSAGVAEAAFLKGTQEAHIPGTEIEVQHFENIVAKGGQWEGMTREVFDRFATGVAQGTLPREELLHLANIHNIDLQNVLVDNRPAIDFIMDHREQFAALSPDLKQQLLSHPAALAKPLLERGSDAGVKAISVALGLAGLGGGYFLARKTETKATTQRGSALDAERIADEKARGIVKNKYREARIEKERKTAKKNETRAHKEALKEDRYEDFRKRVEKGYRYEYKIGDVRWVVTGLDIDPITRIQSVEVTRKDGKDSDTMSIIEFFKMFDDTKAKMVSFGKPETKKEEKPGKPKEEKLPVAKTMKPKEAKKEVEKTGGLHKKLKTSEGEVDIFVAISPEGYPVSINNPPADLWNKIKGQKVTTESLEKAWKEYQEELESIQ